MPKLFAKFYNLFFGDRLYLFNIGATFGAQLVTAISVLILMPKLLDALGEQQFAVYGIILNAIIFGGMFDFGMNIGLLRRIIHENNQAGSLMSLVFTFYMMLFAVGTPILMLVHSSTSVFMSGLTPFQLVLLAILVLQNILATLFDIVIQSTQKIFKAKMIRMGKIIAELVSILLVLQEGSLNLVLICMVVFNLVYMLALRYQAASIVGVEAPLFFFKFDLLKAHLKYSFWYFLAALATILVFNSQLFVLDLMAGPHVVAEFVLFNRFFEIIRFAVSNFTVVLQPTIVDSEVNNPSKVKHLYITSITRVVLLLIGVFLIFNQWGYDIFMWWSKHRFDFDKSLFQLFLLYTILILIDNVSALFLSALKLNKTPTLVSLIQGSLVVLAPVFFYESFGLFGVIAASCAALLLTNFIFNPVYLWKRIQH